jgi:diaminopimelate epimerase
MQLRFVKMNGAGNDFVMLDNRDLALHLPGEIIARLCDRHRGVGADGLLLVEPGQNGADFRMRYYNADGGEAEMCGNGARCFARFVNSLHDNTLERVSFDTPAGRIAADFAGDQVRINMSEPVDIRLGIELEAAGKSLTVHHLNTGVPHAVVFLEDIENLDIRALGAALRFHSEFAPRGANANFARVVSPGHLSIRTYERGVEDETLACGTGMVACALAHHLATGAPSPVRVTVRGGDTLEVGFEKAGDTAFSNVTLFGPADFVFEGAVSTESISH